ncbi:MAG: hypothetical protein SPJ78_08005 [Corynebacterium camporealensis]|uniref:hypothetical protein n=1 Tax=Corynebacterium camporealensis TaxID=161896 RepID=UPI002A916ADE|nr:hypothetical protein [Corynebacterium camporealensis]MDY5840640.1 hypothetical protein [Corynebacterium camporealensis]
MPRINISLNGINLADFRQIIALVMTLITIVGGVAGLVGAGGSSSGGGGIPSIGTPAGNPAAAYRCAQRLPSCEQ